MTTTPVIVIGAGLAGLTTALELAPLPVTVVTTGTLTTAAASDLAQGGIAAAIADDDSPALHAMDTIAAGAGLCDIAAVQAITVAGPDSINWLTRLGARFDRTPDGNCRVGLEAAHSRHRIVHACGDGTGHEVLRAVVEQVQRTPSISVLEHARAIGLLHNDAGQVCGVVLRDGTQLAARAVVLATGGVGGLFEHTTNPLGARGQGLAMAYRVGAELRDLEMVQFHPTALRVRTGDDARFAPPLPLVSEAVRGAGAALVDAHGVPITEDPLAPRDVMARLVYGCDAYLDARRSIGSRFPTMFPTVYRHCRAAGIDPVTQLIPITTAAHYHMGGVTTDLDGRTTVPGLWAVGEVASTGLHGANRLASNSLLEAVVMGRAAAAALARTEPIRADVAPQVVTGGGPDLDWLRSAASKYLNVERETQGMGGLMGLTGADTNSEVSPGSDAALVIHLMAHAALSRQHSVGAHTVVAYGGNPALPPPAPFEAVPHTVVRINELQELAA